MRDVIHVKRPDIEPAVWAAPIPLAVIELCESNSHVMTWWALRWLMLVFPDREGFGRREIGRRARVSEGRAHKYLEYLCARELIETVGKIEIRNLNARPIYTIDLLKLEQMSIAMVLPVITSWGAKPRPRKPSEQQTSFLFTPESPSGIDRFQTTDTSGIDRFQEINPSGINGFQTSGIDRFHLMKGSERNGEERDSSDSSIPTSATHENCLTLESVAAPAGEIPLPAHPIEMWSAACPTSDADDRVRLAAYAAEHDQPHKAYAGGCGWYWVGRAILATLNAGGRLHHQRIKGLLDHWRERTTNERSAYGSNAPAYDRRRARRRAEQAISATVEPSSPPPELRQIWQQTLDQLAGAIDAAHVPTWLKPTALRDLDETRAVVGASNIFAKEKLDQEYHAAIVDALSAICGQPVTVEFVIESAIGEMS